MRSLLSCLLIGASLAAGQEKWVRTNPIPTTQGLVGASFLDENIGFAAGQSGLVLKTIDGGAHWAVVSPDSVGTATCIQFLTPKIGFEGFSDAPMRKTEDGGATWKALDSITMAMSAHFLDANHGYIASALDSVVLKTSDGGKTWKPQPLGASVWSGAICFLDTSKGFLVGNYGTIASTVDGGAHWKITTDSLQASPGLWAIHFVDKQVGYIAGDSSTLLKTTDGGAHWVPLTAGFTSNFKAVRFLNKDTGFVAGYEGVILSTTDGGAKWKLESSELDCAIRALAVSGKSAFAVGDVGSVFTSKSGGPWMAQTNMFPVNFNAVSFPDAKTGYAVGNWGYILKTLDGAGTWTRQSSGTKRSLNAVHFLSASTGFAAGDSGTLLGTEDGGASWKPLASGTKQNLLALRFPDSQTGYAGGDTGFLAKTTDAGKTWKPFSIGRKTNIKSWSFPTASAVYGLSAFLTTAQRLEGFTVFRSRDGGKTWDSLATHSRFYHSLCFKDADTGFIVHSLQAGVINRSVDGGETWDNAYTGRGLDKIQFRDSRVGYAFGGLMVKTIDGGASWSPYFLNTEGYVNALAFPDGDHGYGVGNVGQIFKYGTTTISSKAPRRSSIRESPRLRSTQLLFPGLDGSWFLLDGREPDR